MRLNVLLIVSLLAIVITAPVVDAIACDDCSDIGPLREMQPQLTMGSVHPGGNELSFDTVHPAQQGTGTTKDLCPVCSNIAAAMGNACCGAPFMISSTNDLPKMNVFSDPSYTINKPPQS